MLCYFKLRMVEFRLLFALKSFDKIYSIVTIIIERKRSHFKYSKDQG